MLAAADLAMDPQLKGMRGCAGVQNRSLQAAAYAAEPAALTLVSPLETAHRTKRPWQGAVEPPQLASLPEYDEKCYLCPGNERAGGKQTEKYEGTFVFEVSLRSSFSRSRSGLAGLAGKIFRRSMADACILPDNKEMAADSVPRSPKERLCRPPPSASHAPRTRLVRRGRREPLPDGTRPREMLRHLFLTEARLDCCRDER